MAEQQNPSQQNHQQEEKLLQISPYIMQKIGIQPGSTFINIERSVIACIPFKLGINSGSFLAAVSQNETVFFQRYHNVFASISMLLNTGSSQQPIKIFARCILKSILPVKGRENFCLFMIEWKPCPHDLVNAITTIQFLFDRLTNEYEEFKDYYVAINPSTSQAIGYENRAVLVSNGVSTKIAAFRFSSKHIDFLVPVSGPQLQAKSAVQIKLDFKNFSVLLSGTVSTSEQLANGAQKTSVELTFSPELVDIVENYRFIDSIAKKSGPSANEQT
ncbi:MAG TPA: hypothetical protein P5519_06175 [Spirochaetia bacterium]|nr:hypothetical protein [Spirochaetales bacterium]HPD80173.1 hypothetical protein [Spirochaetales bacterium]HRS65459.1 hypothetical protein [Spirochaetia bacterium]HRV28054.1 hypothetical protein [Spirochaetia bacterium]